MKNQAPPFDFTTFYAAQNTPLQQEDNSQLAGSMTIIQETSAENLQQVSHNGDSRRRLDLDAALVGAGNSLGHARSVTKPEVTKDLPLPFDECPSEPVVMSSPPRSSPQRGPDTFQQTSYFQT